MKTALLLLLVMVAGSAVAAPPWRDDGSREYRDGGREQRGDRLSLDAAVAQVQDQTGGRVLSAETVRAGGRKVHRVKVLTRDYRVQVFELPAD